MIAFKKADLVLQLILFVITVVCMFSNKFEIGVFSLVALGAVQLISAVTHFFVKPRLWNSIPRVVYYFLSIACLLVFLLIYLKVFREPIMVLLYMVFITGGVAITYMLICLMELKKLDS